MRLLEKIKCLNGMKMMGFRLGVIVKCKNNKCYQIYEWVKWFYYLYYYVFIVFLLIYFFFTGVSLIPNIYFGIFFSLSIIYMLEYILLFITPMKEVKCYWMDIQNMKK